jgi:hypothetical protein
VATSTIIRRRRLSPSELVEVPAEPAGSGRRMGRGELRGSAPPTPPYARVRGLLPQGHGVGAEWAVARTWTVKLEYLHFGFESEAFSGGYFSLLGPGSNNPVSSSVTASQSGLSVDTVRVGFNHTFN